MRKPSRLSGSTGGNTDIDTDEEPPKGRFKPFTDGLSPQWAKVNVTALRHRFKTNKENPCPAELDYWRNEGMQEIDVPSSHQELRQAASIFWQHFKTHEWDGNRAAKTIQTIFDHQSVSKATDMSKTLRTAAIAMAMADPMIIFDRRNFDENMCLLVTPNTVIWMAVTAKLGNPWVWELRDDPALFLAQIQEIEEQHRLRQRAIDSAWEKRKVVTVTPSKRNRADDKTATTTAESGLGVNSVSFAEVVKIPPRRLTHDEKLQKLTQFTVDMAHNKNNTFFLLELKWTKDNPPMEEQEQSPLEANPKKPKPTRAKRSNADQVTHLFKVLIERVFKAEPNATLLPYKDEEVNQRNYWIFSKDAEDKPVDRIDNEYVFARQYFAHQFINPNSQSRRFATYFRLGHDLSRDEIEPTLKMVAEPAYIQVAPLQAPNPVQVGFGAYIPDACNPKWLWDEITKHVKYHHMIGVRYGFCDDGLSWQERQAAQRDGPRKGRRKGSKRSPP